MEQMEIDRPLQRLAVANVSDSSQGIQERSHEKDFKASLHSGSARLREVLPHRRRCVEAALGFLPVREAERTPAIAIVRVEGNVP
mmetsp:Transcript_13452/g.20443  ORF Transcript_13452/g.20443 Transcript_13452/m.20443 type:complete len:85 (+) Transcript_13452:202-456(+)